MDRFTPIPDWLTPAGIERKEKECIDFEGMAEKKKKKIKFPNGANRVREKNTKLTKGVRWSLLRNDQTHYLMIDYGVVPPPPFFLSSKFLLSVSFSGAESAPSFFFWTLPQLPA